MFIPNTLTEIQSRILIRKKKKSLLLIFKNKNGIIKIDTPLLIKLDE